MNSEFVLRIEASHERLQAAEHEIDELARRLEWPQELLFKVKLAVEEVGLNIINHGYGNDASREIEIRFRFGKDALTVDIIDDAPAYDPLTEAPVPDISLGVAERPVGGLGVKLLKDMMDEISYAREDNRNHLTLKIRSAP